MRIVFMGTPKFAVPILEALIEKYEVVLVVTQPDKPTGRKKELTFSPVKVKALEHNVKVFQPIKIKEEYEEVLNAKPDIIITAAYGQLIPSILLDYPVYKAINVHASLLPKYRGGAPIHYAILNGDTYAGVTIMYMAQKMDAGEIIKQDKLLIMDLNTTELTEKLSYLGRDLLLDTLADIKNIKSTPQEEKDVTFAFNIKPEMERINWEENTIKIYNHIRALANVPGAYTTYNGMKVKIYEAKYELIDNPQEPGEITIYNKILGIKTKDGIIYPTTIQVEGKKAMNIKDFYNGASKYFVVGEKMI